MSDSLTSTKQSLIWWVVFTKNVCFTGGIGAKRFCSSLDLGNYCNYVSQPGDLLNYRTCIYTCKGDGCNPATRPQSQFFIILGAIALTTYQILKS